MRTQKLLAIFLALLMASTGLVGCGQGASEETQTQENTDISTTETETEEETKVSDDLPESDFEGYAFNIFNSNPESNNWFTTVHVTAEEDSGDSVPSAIFNRNLLVEDRLNIQIVETEQTTDQIKNTIVAGDGSFDMSLMQGSAVLTQAQSGYLMDLHELPYQNFDKPYWDHNAVEQLSICGKLYMGVGDFLTTQIDETCCMFFNKGLIDNHGLDDPYELVNEGKWTLDKMAEMASVAHNDADGNGTFDDNDEYGLMSWRGVYYMFLLNGAGQTLITKDEKDIPAFTFYNENFVSAYEKILNITHGSGEGLYYDAEMKTNTKGLSNNHRVQEIMFPNDQVLFWVECISWAKALRDMDTNFGILPAPKYDEEQTQYYSCNNGNFFGMSIPVSVSDVDRTSIILEALQSASTDTVRAAYYETTLKTKLTRDEKSAVMVDLIFDTTTYDCSTVYGLGSVKTNIYQKASNNDTDLASFWEKQQTSLDTTIQKIVTNFEKLG